MITEIVRQLERTERLLDRATKACANLRGLRSGDRAYTPLIESALFAQGEAPGQNIVWNVPADTDYWAYRLMIYPMCRVIDPVYGTPDDVVFRPTSFIGEPYSAGAIDPEDYYTDLNCSVDGLFALLLNGRELQNTDIPWQSAYCTNMGKWISPGDDSLSSVTYFGGATQTPGGYVFDIPLFLPRGSAITCRLTPTYLGVRTIEEEIDEETTIVRQHQYKIVAVLEGERKMNPLR